MVDYVWFMLFHNFFRAVTMGSKLCLKQNDDKLCIQCCAQGHRRQHFLCI